MNGKWTVSSVTSQFNNFVFCVKIVSPLCLLRMNFRRTVSKSVTVTHVTKRAVGVDPVVADNIDLRGASVVFCYVCEMYKQLQVLCDVAPCRMVNSLRSARRFFWDWGHEDEGTTILRNVGNSGPSVIRTPIIRIAGWSGQFSATDT